MKLSFASFACALGVTTARQGRVRKLSPGVKVTNLVYAGNDYGMGCGKRGQKSISDNTKASLVYCFEVVNTGNTRLNNVVLTSAELNDFFDNSINHLEPGESKIVPFIYTLDGDLVSNVVVTATPVHPDGKPIGKFEKITATDSSEVVDVIARSRKLQGSFNPDYASPVTGLNNCIQKEWEVSTDSSDLLQCAAREVYIQDESLAAEEDSQCIEGTKTSLTLDATIVVDRAVTFDLGWYIDTSGGMALDGSKCVVNGLFEPNEYTILNAKNRKVPVDGGVMWRPDSNDDFMFSIDDAAGARIGDDKDDRKKRKQRELAGDDFINASNTTTGDYDEGDGDDCGDVYILSESAGLIPITIAVDIPLTCVDTTDNGLLDISICFTWRNQGGNECTFGTNVPEDVMGGCHCSRYNIKNVHVIKKSDILPC